MFFGATEQDVNDAEKEALAAFRKEKRRAKALRKRTGHTDLEQRQDDLERRQNALGDRIGDAQPATFAGLCIQALYNELFCSRLNSDCSDRLGLNMAATARRFLSQSGMIY